MGAHDDVDPAVSEAFDGRLRLALGGEPAERRDVDREAGVTIGEGGVMLLHQQGGRHQDRHLLAVLDSLERGAYRNLSLAVADIATDQPIHWDDLLHVALDVLDRTELVRCLDESEGVLKLALPGGVG